MRKWLDRLLNFVGFEREEPEARGETLEDGEIDAWEYSEPPPVKRKGTLVSLPGPKSLKVVLVAPRSFDEVQGITDHLKNRRPVILNLQQTDKELAQRVLNFLGGSIYALNGSMQRIGSGIFFFTPSNYELVSGTREDWREPRGLPWEKVLSGDDEV